MGTGSQKPEAKRIADKIAGPGIGGASETRGERLKRFLETRVWPKIPANLRGKALTKKKEEEILGFGPEGF